MLTACVGNNKLSSAPDNINRASNSIGYKHIADLFYRDSTGHLYQKTVAQIEVAGVDSLVDTIYFNGAIPQDLDAVTFKELNGWYAMDKRNAYYYRPTSDGMVILKLPHANVSTFRVLEGDYRYAVDAEHVYIDGQLVAQLSGKNRTIKRSSTGKITAFKQGILTYKTDTLQ